MKILICGLPGAGKTILAKTLTPLLNAVHFNADDVRSSVHTHLGFGMEDRKQHAKNLGIWADFVNQTHDVVVDFVCPTEETRRLFNPEFVIWVDRIKEGRFEDTNQIWEDPKDFHYRVDENNSPEYHAYKILEMIRPVFDETKPTAMFLGRYQPFHNGHKNLIEHGIKEIGQALIAVRNMPLTDNNPFGFEFVKTQIENGLWNYRNRIKIISVPNVTNIMYGRDVGYKIERVDLDQSLTEISATNIRKRIQT